MKSGTKVSIADNLHVEYYELEGMKRHYLVYENYGLRSKSFMDQAGTVNYIIGKLK